MIRICVHYSVVNPESDRGLGWLKHMYKFKPEPDKGFGVGGGVQSWDISPLEAVISVFFPNYGTPPAPPVA